MLISLISSWANWNRLRTTWLLGGLEHFGFFHILGIISPTDFHIFQRGWNHQPVVLSLIASVHILGYTRSPQNTMGYGTTQGGNLSLAKTRTLNDCPSKSLCKSMYVSVVGPSIGWILTPYWDLETHCWYLVSSWYQPLLVAGWLMMVNSA